MKRFLSLVCLLGCMGSKVFSQSVFTWDLKKDLVIGSLSLGVGITPFFIKNEPANVPTEFNKKDVNPLDRSFLFPYNKPVDLVSDYGVYSMLLLPVISVIPNITKKNAFLTYGIMYTEALLLTFGTKDLLKNTVIRYRPYTYTDSIPDGKEGDYYKSFPSGSTALAFLGATFLTTTWVQEFPESPWKLPVILGSYTLAAGVASMRIASGSHFLTDVLMGAAIGSFYGWVIPWLHLKKDKTPLSIIPTGNGLIVSLTL